MKKSKKNADKPATQKDITSLKKDVTFIKKDVTSLKKDVTFIKKDITSLKKDVKLLEKKLDSKIDQLRKDSQEDLELMGGNLTCQIDEVKEDLEEFRQENTNRLDKQDRILESLLVVTQTLSGQLAPIKETPEKVENHEQRITDLEVQARMIHR